jgi:hypothetical protein
MKENTVALNDKGSVYTELVNGEQLNVERIRIYDESFS